jgi:hypothetical protein
LLFGCFNVNQHRRHRHRAWLWSLLAIAVVAGGLRLGLNPVARHLTRQLLNSNVSYHGDFEDLSISLSSLRYRLGGVTLVRDPDPVKGHTETVYVKAFEARLLWKELWHFRLAGVLSIDGAKATYEIASRAQLHDAIAAAEAFADRPNLGGLVEGLIPFRITRVEVRRSEVLVIDRTEKGVPEKSAELWLHDVEATLENFGSRSDLLQGAPTTLAMQAKLQRQGELTMFMTLDPLAYKLDVEGEANVRHLPLDELYGFMVGLTQLKTKSGTLDAFATFRCQDGYIDGSVKPMLANLELQPTQKNVGNHLLATAGNAAADVASEGGVKHEIATVIPFGGRVTDPEPHLWPALLTFLEGSTKPGFAPLPPSSQATADKKAAPTQEATADSPKRPARATPPRPGQPPLSTSPQGVFERGAVPKIQKALSSHGLATATSRTLEGATERQLVSFQDQQSLPGTGFPDRETLHRLGLDADVLYRSNRN